MSLAVIPAHADQWASFPEESQRRAAGAQFGSAEPPAISGAQAFGLSVIATATPIVSGYAMHTTDEKAGFGLMAAGLMFGPSVGYHAAGLHGRGNLGIVLRCAIAVAGATAAAVAHNTSVEIDGQPARVTFAGLEPPQAIGWGSAIVLSASALWDMLSVARDVERVKRPRYLVDAGEPTRTAAVEAP